MATGYILLDPAAGTLPDGTTGNAAAGLVKYTGTESNPKKPAILAIFSPTTDCFLWFKFQMPGDYSSGGEVKLLWTSNDTGASESCRWEVSLGAITPADADTPLEHASAATSGVTTDVNTTEANRLIESSITLANLDSVAAGDLVFLNVMRNADDGADDLTSNSEVYAITFSYTTT